MSNLIHVGLGGCWSAEARSLYYNRG